MCGRADAVRRLVDAGADVDATARGFPGASAASSDADAGAGAVMGAGREEEAPLHSAVQADKVEMVR